MFKNRHYAFHFLSFFIGFVTLVYQAAGYTFLGDSVSFMCWLTLFSGLSCKRIQDTIANATLITLGYMIPLLLRNILKNIVASEGFLTSALSSFAITFLFALLFSAFGYILSFVFRKLLHLAKGKITLSKK